MAELDGSNVEVGEELELPPPSDVDRKQFKKVSNKDEDLEVAEHAAIAKQAAEEAAEFNKEVDETRQTIAMWTLISCLVVVVLVLVFFAVKFGLFMRVSGSLIKDALKQQDLVRQKQMMVFLGVLFAGQSTIAMAILYWAGKLIRDAYELMVPLKDRDRGGLLHWLRPEDAKSFTQDQ